MTRRLLLGLLALTGLPALAPAYPPVRWSVGINLGAPYYGRPWGYPYRYYYAPPPVVYAPAPVVVPVPAAAAPVALAPTAAAPAPAVVQANHPGSVTRCDQLLQQLNDPQEAVRQEAAIELGRMKAQKAVDPLTVALSGDNSPTVREAAARALGLIASPRGLNALITAAQADQDRDVRHSAQFAVEVIRTNLRN